MKRQFTERSRCRSTSTTHRDVSHAHGHTGSQKNSTSETCPVFMRASGVA